MCCKLEVNNKEGKTKIILKFLIYKFPVIIRQGTVLTMSLAKLRKSEQELRKDGEIMSLLSERLSL